MSVFHAFEAVALTLIWWELMCLRRGCNPVRMWWRVRAYRKRMAGKEYV